MIVAATRILDEIDIVEAFVRHTAAFVDHHLLLDNGSRDGTLGILAALRVEGLPLTVLSNPSVAFAEDDANTALFREAVALGAAWVVFLDADEFIDDRSVDGGLAGKLNHAVRYRPLVSQLKVGLTDYIPIHADDPGEAVVPRRVKWRGERSENFKSIVHARVARDGAMIRAGGHGACWPHGNEVWPYVIDPDLTYAHYSERNSWQWISKFVRGWSKVLAAGETEVARGSSLHYEPAFRLLRDHPEAILENPVVMGWKNERPGLRHDPIDYRGGALRYTPPIDHRLRAVSGMMRHLEALARRHGRLLDASPEARRLTSEWDRIDRLQ
jgi:hypothetical protein